MQGVFWNPRDEQNPKPSLGVQFDQVFMEETQKTSCCKIRGNRRTGAYFKHSCMEMALKDRSVLDY